MMDSVDLPSYTEVDLCETNFCKHCGARVSGANYCPHCGKLLLPATPPTSLSLSTSKNKIHSTSTPQQDDFATTSPRKVDLQHKIDKVGNILMSKIDFIPFNYKF